MLRRYLLWCVLAAASGWGQSAPGPGQPWSEDYAEQVRMRLSAADPTVRADAQSELRRHGWDLLARVVSDSRRPVWYYQWCNLDEILKPQLTICSPDDPAGVKIGPKATGRALPANILGILSTSYYNPAMVAYLRKDLSASAWQDPARAANLAGLSVANAGVDHPGQTMQALAAMFRDVQRGDFTGQLPPVPADGIVVKPGWFLLRCPKTAASPMPQVGTWDGSDHWDPYHPARHVTVKPKTMQYGPCQVDPSMKRRGGDRSLFDFFYFRSLNADRVTLEGVPQTESFEKGDYLVLVGLHVITREDPNWIWTTFWWDNNPTEIQDRPAWVAKDRKLKYFNMRITLGDPKEVNPAPVFNPYLEGTQANGTQSNCIACHRNAAVKAVWNGQSFALTAVPPKMEDRNTESCASAVCTNFLWSIALRAKALGQ